MLDLNRTPDGFLDPITRVVETALTHSSELEADKVMVVGAWCRDILHAALEHDFATTATRDLDLALALSSWNAYASVAAAFPRAGDTGIRFRIADMSVDLMPFGAVEDPQGLVAPPTRGQTLSVWAFEEIFGASLPLILSSEISIRIPTIAGFAAAKLGAWLDRAEWGEGKDAADLALIAYWYAESTRVHDRLYESPEGNHVLITEQADVPLAAAHLLGLDVVSTIGAERTAELLDRWPGDIELLIRELVIRGGPHRTGGADRRRSLVDALTRGLQSEP